MSNNIITNSKKKRPAWTRGLDIVLRTAHVIITSVLFGGTFFGISYHQLILWYCLTVATGCALIASEVYHRRYWPFQGRGIMVYIHIGLIGLIHLIPDLKVELMTAVIVFGMVGSHMPKKFRYWSFVHKRVID